MTTNYIKLNELVGKIKRAYLYAQTNSTKAVLEGIGESGYASPYENNTKLLYSLLNDLKKLKA